MCDEAVGNSLAALKLVPNWFVISKMIKELFTALQADENMLYFNEVSDNVVFSCNEMGILNINLNNFNLDNNFDEDDPDTIFLSDFSLGILYLKKTKHVKKELNEELMPVA